MLFYFYYDHSELIKTVLQCFLVLKLSFKGVLVEKNSSADNKKSRVLTMKKVSITADT